MTLRTVVNDQPASGRSQILFYCSPHMKQNQFSKQHQEFTKTVPRKTSSINKRVKAVHQGFVNKNNRDDSAEVKNQTFYCLDIYSFQIKRRRFRQNCACTFLPHHLYCY